MSKNATTTSQTNAQIADRDLLEASPSAGYRTVYAALNVSTGVRQ